MFGLRIYWRHFKRQSLFMVCLCCLLVQEAAAFIYIYICARKIESKQSDQGFRQHMKYIKHENIWKFSLRAQLSFYEAAAQRDRLPAVTDIWLIILADEILQMLLNSHPAEKNFTHLPLSCNRELQKMAADASLFHPLNFRSAYLRQPLDDWQVI